MAFFSFVRPKWMSKDSEKRRNALSSINKNSQIEKIHKFLINYDNSKSDLFLQTVLYDIFRYTENDEIRHIALSKLENQNYIREIATNFSFGKVFIEMAFEKIGDQQTLYDIFRYTENDEIRHIALSKLENQNYIKEIATDFSFGKAFIEMAIDKINDQRTLQDIFERKRSKWLRKLVLKRKAFLKRNPDLNVKNEQVPLDTRLKPRDRKTYHRSDSNLYYLVNVPPGLLSEKLASKNQDRFNEAISLISKSMHKGNFAALKIINALIVQNSPLKGADELISLRDLAATSPNELLSDDIGLELIEGALKYKNELISRAKTDVIFQFPNESQKLIWFLINLPIGNPMTEVVDAICDHYPKATREIALLEARIKLSAQAAVSPREEIGMKSSYDYAVIIGSDRLANDEDISWLQKQGALGLTKQALTLHVQMGSYKEIFKQASVTTYPKQFFQMAISELKNKGVKALEASLTIDHFTLPDGAVFVIVKER